MNYNVIGKVDGITISEPVQNVSQYAREAIPTAKRKIINKFRAMGYNEEDIIFEQIETKKL